MFCAKRGRPVLAYTVVVFFAMIVSGLCEQMLFNADSPKSAHFGLKTSHYTYIQQKTIASCMHVSVTLSCIHGHG